MRDEHIKEILVYEPCSFMQQGLETRMKNFTGVALKTFILFFLLGTAISNASVRKVRSLKERDRREVSSESAESEETGRFITPATDHLWRWNPDTGTIGSARPIYSVLVGRNLTTFLELLNEAGITDLINLANNITLFVPTNEVLAEPETAAKVEDLMADKDKLIEVLLFHMTGPAVQTCDSDTEVKSRLANNSLRINKFKTKSWYKTESRFTLECARISKFDPKACEDRVLEIDRLLQPPTGSVYDVIQRDPKYSTLKEILQGTKLEEVLKSATSITFLAPVNDVFNRVDPDVLEEIKNEKCVANAVLGHLVLQGMVCCAHMGRYSEELELDDAVNLRGKSVSFTNRLIAYVDDVGLTPNNLEVILTDCDIMATNGVIHSVNHFWLDLTPWLVSALNKLKNGPKTEELCGI